MKTLYFIRHAKSSWKDAQLSDFDRPLNKRGKADAPLMAKRLKHHSVTPDLILSSPALRAKKTAQIIAKELGIEAITYEPLLYESSFETYVEILRALPPTAQNVLIVAHNPEITYACELLADAIFGNIPTCGIVGLELTVETFQEVGEGCAHVLFFDYPKKHR
ncbi:MAG: histidine phosphatase family protein [Campylobacterales bacterium]|nr:histidine phosphatase family protein [Campylobacterales bacterium]